MLSNRATTQNVLRGAPGAADATDPGPTFTLRGILLLLLGLALGLSSSRSLRMDISGMLVHPYLLVLVVLAVVIGPSSYGRLPASQRNALVAFSVIFMAVALLHGDALPEVAKAVTTLLTIWTLAVAAQRLEEVRLGALGMSISLGLIAFQALGQTSSDPYAPVPFGEVGNRNAYSLYALPAILVGVFFVIERATPQWQRLVFVACAGVTTLSIFLTGNRSGWMGAVVIGILVAARGRRVRDVFIVVTMGLSIMYVLTTFFGTQVIDERLDRDEKTKESDQSREDLAREAIDIGFEHPLAGIGPQYVDDELGKRLPFGEGVQTREAHNLQGYLFAGGGVPLIASFTWLLVALWRRPREWTQAYPRPGPLEVEGRRFVQMTIVLFFVRGLFSQEIWSIPGFLLGFGFALSVAIVGYETTTPVANTPEPATPTSHRTRPSQLAALASSAAAPAGHSTAAATTTGKRRRLRPRPRPRRPNLVDREFQRRRVLGISTNSWGRDR